MTAPYIRERYNPPAQPPSNGKLPDWLRLEFGRIHRAIPHQREEVDLRDFLPGRNGVTNDASKLQQAIGAAYSFAADSRFRINGRVYVPAGDYYIGSTTITIPAGVDFIMSAAANLLYSGTGVAVEIIGVPSDDADQVGGEYALSVARATIDWDDSATDTGSVGVRLVNVRWSDVRIHRALNFVKGVVLRGDDDGCVDNIVRLGEIRGNKIGLHVGDNVNGGWANQNVFLAGHIRLDSGQAGEADTRLIQNDANGCSFLGINLEGGNAEKTIEATASRGMYLNCRLEGVGTGEVHFTGASSANWLISGYDNWGPETDPFLDEGTGNIIWGGRGLRLCGDGGSFGSSAALILEAISSGSNNLFELRNQVQGVFLRANGAGQMSFYDSTGYDPSTNPNGQIVIDAADSAIKFTPVGGSTLRTLVRISSDDIMNMRTTLHVDPAGGNARISSGAVTLPDGDTTPSVAIGNVFLTANTGATTISDFDLGREGQRLTIRAGDALTTIAHNANIILKGAANKLLALGETIELLAYGSGAPAVWYEVGENRHETSSPAQITSNQNNYATGTADTLRLTTDAARNITGFAGGVDGRTIRVINVGAQDIVLQNQNASSTDINRIITGTGADITVAADDVVQLHYDGTTQRWRVTNHY